MTVRSAPRWEAFGTRVDRRTGIREEVEFFGRAGERLFATRYLPPTETGYGLVICSPLFAEFAHNYRKEVLLARSLAADGVAIQRFHYRGTGNSHGDADAVTFEAMLADALTAAERLMEKNRIANLAFLGTRLAATVAVVAATRSGDAPVALWEPTLDPRAYFREVVRHAAIRDLKDGVASDEGSGDLLSRIETEGSIDVVGYPIHRGLYRTFIEHRLMEELAARQRPVLLVQLMRKRELRREYATFLGELVGGGYAAEGRAVWTDESWWFTGDPSHSERVTKPLVEVTSDWLLPTLRQGPSR